MFSPVRVKSFQIRRRAKPAVHHLPHVFTVELAKDLRGEIDIIMGGSNAWTQQGEHLLRIGPKFLPHSADGRRHHPRLRPPSATMHQGDRPRLSAMNPDRPAIRHPDHERSALFPGNQRVHSGNCLPCALPLEDSHPRPMGLLPYRIILWQFRLLQNSRNILRYQRGSRTKGKGMTQTPRLQLRKS